MASITQTIPNYFGGISQVPDSQKGQGQVTSAINFIPDINRGLMKRPGSARISAPAALATDTTPAIPPYAALVGATQSGTWFHYYRDEDEGSYIGQVQTDGTVNIWDVETGAPQNVTQGPQSVKDYLLAVNPDTTIRGNEDLQFTTIADTTFVNNRNVTVAWDTTQTTDDHPRAYTAFAEIKRIENGRQYGLNVHDPTDTANPTVTVTSATLLTVSPNDPEGYTSYSGGNGHCPDVGTGVFVEGPINRGNDPESDNLIYRVTVTGQQGPDPNHTSALEKPDDYTCSYNVRVDLLHGGDGWLSNRNGQHDSVTCNVAGRIYTVEVEEHESAIIQANRGLVRPRPTSFDQQTSVSVDTILGGIKNEFTQIPNVIAKIIGNGIYINASSSYPTVVEAQNTDLINVINQEVNSIADLPFQCKHGFIVKVVNSNVAEDDYYLRFEGIEDEDGPGTWVECAAPGINKRLDRSTMPIVIRRTGSSGGIADFTVEEFEYPDREVGDTDLDPSFVGKKINKVIHFRNRLGFLADSNVILARPGEDVGNFFVNTALTVSGTDPIDISASSQYPGKLYDAIEINTGLLVFGEKQQFLLATDSDILNIETARLSNISSYNYNKNIPPFSLGTVAGFVDNAGAKSRFFVMSNVAREGEPNVNELSKPVFKLLPKDIDLVSNSRENSIVLFGKRGTNSGGVAIDNVYVYKYFNVADKQVQSSWTEWIIQRGVNYMCAIGNSVYIVNSDLYLTKLNLVEDESDPKVQEFNLGFYDYGGEYPVHLDNYVVLEGSNGTISLPGTTSPSYGQCWEVAGSAAPLINYGHATNFIAGWPSGVRRIISVVPDRLTPQDALGSASTATMELPTGTIVTNTIGVPYEGSFWFLDTSPTEPCVSTNNETAQVATYNSDTGKTIFNLTNLEGFGGVHENDSNGTLTYRESLTVVHLRSGAYKEVEFRETTPGSYAHSRIFELDGNYTTGEIVIGAPFFSYIEFPKFFVQEVKGDRTINETRGNLVLHRAKLTFDVASRLHADIWRKSTEDQHLLRYYEASQYGSYTLGSATVEGVDFFESGSITFTATIPIYLNSNDMQFWIQSDDPFPCTLLSLTWEGDYSPKYYKNV